MNDLFLFLNFKKIWMLSILLPFHFACYCWNVFQERKLEKWFFSFCHQICVCAYNVFGHGRMKLICVYVAMPWKPFSIWILNNINMHCNTLRTIHCQQQRLPYILHTCLMFMYIEKQSFFYFFREMGISFHVKILIVSLLFSTFIFVVQRLPQRTYKAHEKSKKKNAFFVKVF